MPQTPEPTEKLDPALATAVVEQMDEGLCIVDGAGIVQYANPAARELLADAASTLRGRYLCDELLAPGDGTTALREALRARHARRNQEALVRADHSGGRPLAIDVWPLAPGSDTTNMAVLLRDISRRRGAERQLRRRVDELQAIVSGAGLAILVLTLEGEITFGNHACADIFGYASEALVGTWLVDLLVEDDRPVITPLLQQLIRGEKKRFQRECRWRRPDRPLLWGNLTASLLRRADGTPRLILAIIEDIHPRKAAEAELREVKRRLARSREQLQQRLAQELHDGPIQDIYAAQYQLQALQRTIQTESGEKLLNATEVILRQVVGTLRTIMSELRPPALAPFGLQAALHSLADQFEERFPDLLLTREIDADGKVLPEHSRLTLYRIAQEMLNNVAQHAGAQHALLRFELNDTQLLLEVQDDGSGFEVPERWIELARRDHLGLVGISERAEEIDGQLTILSAPQQGTIVRVIAPCPMEENHDKDSRVTGG